LPRLYFAGPLFSEAERIFNATLTERIEELGFAVFLPQRDGFEKQGSQHATLSVEQVARRIFELDKSEVYRSDVLLMILDGRVPDEGAALELGLAHADRERRGIRRPLIGLMTDWRSAFPNEPLNAMLFGALDEVHTTVDATMARLAAVHAELST
jgi:nucleoside 2-deoxyribosyltransferase